MVASRDRLFMTAGEYLEWEAQQPCKYEYLNGEVYAMTGGTLSHNAVAVNLVSLLRNHVRGTDCRVFVNDVKVQASPQSAYFYPDVVVTCDERDIKAKNLVQYPCLIIEILSPSTEAYDRGEKFKQYRKLASLKEYVLVNAESMGIECYRLNQQGKWELTPYFPEESTQSFQIEFPSIGFECPFFLVYEDVELPEAGTIP